MSSRLALWVRASRAPFLTASVLPALLGGLAAYGRTGGLDALGLAATLAGVACVHLGANIANEYFDYRTGCDAMNPRPTPFSGGSRVIQEGLLSPRAMATASAAFFAAGAALGLYLNARVPGNTVLCIGLAGIAGGIAYTAQPLKLSYRGWGEAVVFACFGPLAVAGSYVVQAGRTDFRVLLISLPAGLLVAAILLVNEVLDAEWDGLAGKRTLVVLLGRERGYSLFLAVYTAAYVCIALGILGGLFRPAASVSGLPVLLWARRLAPGAALADRASTIKASAAAIRSQALTVLLLALSYLL